jgi:hypothetical protein
MADLHKYTVQESLNASQGVSGKFTQLDASSGGLGGSAAAVISAGSSADVTNTKHLDLDPSTHQLLIYSAGDLYFNFANSDEDIIANNSLILPGNQLISLAVPRGVGSRGDTIRFNFNSTSTTTHTVRIVEV